MSSMGDYQNIFPKENKLTTSLLSGVKLLPRVLGVLPEMVEKIFLSFDFGLKLPLL